MAILAFSMIWEYCASNSGSSILGGESSRYLALLARRLSSRSCFSCSLSACLDTQSFSLVLDKGTLKHMKFQTTHNNSNRLFIVPYLVGAQSAYSGIRICSFHHTHACMCMHMRTHTHTHIQWYTDTHIHAHTHMHILQIHALLESGGGLVEWEEKNRSV